MLYFDILEAPYLNIGMNLELNVLKKIYAESAHKRVEKSKRRQSLMINNFYDTNLQNSHLNYIY